MEDKMRWNKIICPVDFSRISLDALDLSAELAQTCGGNIIIVHVLEPIIAPTDFTFGPLSMTDVEDKLADRAMESLKEIIPKLSISPERIEIKVARGIASQEIIKIAEETKADLIVMGTHGYTGFTHALLGSTAERVVRRAPCPVLTMKGKATEK
jgi:nucleotide-binding universal stress UspA family protein